MDLESLALFGEFIGGLAVVVTLVYLAYQSKQSRLLLEQTTGQQAAAMLRANIDGWNHMFATILADQDSVDIYDRLRRGDHFDERGRQRAELLAMMFFLNLENFILQNEKTPFVEGVEEVVQAAAKHHVQAILSSAQLRDWWESEKVCFSPQFRTTVDGLK